MAFPVVGEMGVSEDMIVLVDAAGFGVCWTSSLYLAAGAVLVFISDCREDTVAVPECRTLQWR